MYNLKFQEVVGFLLGQESHEERLGICYPPLDVYECSNELCIEVEIPGVNQKRSVSRWSAGPWSSAE